MNLLDKMATFVRVVEAGSLSAAAKQLRLSSAAVSRQLATLEAELGAPLLLRSTRRMSVTPVGQRYYERCLRILRDVDDAQSIGRSAGLDGLLKINASISFGLTCVVPHLHSLMLKHPGLRMDLRLEDRLIDLLLEGVDVAIRVGSAPPESTGLVAHHLVDFRRVLVASPAYLKKHGTPRTPGALAKCELLVFGGESERWVLTNGRKTVRTPVQAAFRSNALHALRELAVRGAGVAKLPEWFVADEVQRRALRRVLPEWRSEPVAVNAIHRVSHRGEQRVRALIEHLRAKLATLSAAADASA